MRKYPRYLAVMMLALAPVLRADEQAPKVRADVWGDPLPAEALARLGSIRFRHEDAVSAVAFAPDGQTFLSGDTGGRLYLWRIANGKELRRFTGHEFFITSVAFSPKGKLAASASVDESVRLWNIQTGEEVRRFTAQRTVAAVCFAPDGRSLAFAGDERIIYLVDPETGKEVRTFKGHTKGVRALAFSADGKLLASAGRDFTVRVWRTDNGQSLHTHAVTATEQGAKDPGLRSLSFAADGKTLAGADGETVYVWDAVAGRELRRQKAESIQWVAFVPGHQSLLACSGSRGQVGFWRNPGEEKVDDEPRSLPVSNKFEVFSAIAVSADGKLLARAGDGLVRLWNIAERKEITALPGHRGGIHRLAFAPDGRLIATASEDGTARLWEAATGRPAKPFTSHQADAAALAFSRDGKHLIWAGGPGPSVFAFDTVNGKVSRKFLGPKGGLQGGVLSPDGKLFAYVGGERNGPLTLLEVTGGKEMLGVPAQGAYLLAFSADGRLLASAARDAVRLWSLPSRREMPSLHNLLSPDNPIKEIALSPDGQVLAVVGEDSRIRLWETGTGSRIRNLSSLDQGVRVLAFSPNLRVLASGGEDRTVRLWDTVAGRELHRFEGHRHTVTALAFSVDGMRLASAGADFTGLVWDVSKFKGLLAAPFSVNTASLPRLWSELAGTNATRAEDVIWSLAAAPETSVPFVVERFQAVPAIEPARLKGLIADLDHKAFARRKQATTELEKLGEAAAGALRDKLTQSGSLEQRRRMKTLLDKIEKGLVAERRLVPRVIRVLELCATPAARQRLEGLAKGAPGAGRTENARAALARLDHR